jgi:hypothetical protein
MTESHRALVEGFQRARILRAAHHVIAREGRIGATLQAVAGEPGVARGGGQRWIADLLLNGLCPRRDS